VVSAVAISGPLYVALTDALELTINALAVSKL
jgi:hypothetical protein